MISIITYGRNDNYGFNLYKRTAMGFNCLGEALTEEDEIIFVDYSTPNHLPTLPEFLWDTLTEKTLKLLKVVRISPDLHEAIKGDSTLPILENVARNAGIARSNPSNHWLLSTNPDVILVLAGRWGNLCELLQDRPDSFYEMPRFDIPESVWSSLRRDDPRSSIRLLHEWLVENRAAVPETIPDYRFQKLFLFDAPGDFQLAPRSYFFRLRGFDESMNKYLHSDANLAKRMWLLNNQRTDHLLGDLWVLHQDHYLTGEWAQNVRQIQHNDYHAKVINQTEIEANPKEWGLQDFELPFFCLSEQVNHRQRRVFSFRGASDGNLQLSQEPDWRMQPFYRLCHYEPERLTLYLREILQVVAPTSKVLYLGLNATTLEHSRRIWKEISSDGNVVQDLVALVHQDQPVSSDVLLVDCYYERLEYSERRIRLVADQLERQRSLGRISQDEADEEASRFADNVDSQALMELLIPLWKKSLPKIRMRAGSYVILLGCNTYVETFFRFQELFSNLVMGIELKPTRLQGMHSFYQRVKARLQAQSERSLILQLLWGLRLIKRRVFRKALGHESIMGWIYVRHVTKTVRRLREFLKLPTLYVHHRLVVMRVEL